MDSTITLIKKHSSEGDYAGLAKRIEVAVSVKNLKKISPSTLDNVLNDSVNFSAQQYSLGYAEILAYKANHIEFKNHNEFIEQTRALFLSGNETQFSFCIKALANISKQFTKSCLVANNPLRGLAALRSLVYKLTLAIPSQITSIHTDFLQLALKSHAENIATQFLTAYNDSLTVIAPKESGLEVADYLQFHYYSGLCFCVMKNWAAAVNSFELCLSLPTNNVISAIQLAAFSRLQIVTLLNQRVVSNTDYELNNKTTSGIILKHIEQLCSNYVELNKAYRRAADRGKLEEFSSLVGNNVDTFRADKTFGLIKQLSEHAINQHIHRLTNTYLTLPIANIKELVHLSDNKTVENYLIFNKFNYLISSRINSSAGMVEFSENANSYYNSNEEITQFNQKIQQIHSLSAQFKAKDRRIQTNPVYIAKTMPHSIGPQAEGGAAGGGQSRGPQLDEEQQLKLAMQQSLMQQ
jgi:COP9 signalosome complex subunit 3